MHSASHAEISVNYQRTKKHHLQRHELPSKLKSQKVVLKLLGTDTITQALEELRQKKPAQLRVRTHPPIADLIKKSTTFTRCR